MPVVVGTMLHTPIKLGGTAVPTVGVGTKAEWGTPKANIRQQTVSGRTVYYAPPVVEVGPGGGVEASTGGSNVAVDRDPGDELPAPSVKGQNRAPSSSFLHPG